MTTSDTGRQALATVRDRDLQKERSRLTVTEILRKVPSWAMAPGLFALFCALLANLFIADPLPFLDEATMAWLLMSGLRVLSDRRKEAFEARKAAIAAEMEEAEIQAEAAREVEELLSSA